MHRDQNSILTQRLRHKFRRQNKFYSDRVEVNNEFETKIQNLFVGGDGAGITRGLAQAGANGVKIARVIASRK